MATGQEQTVNNSFDFVEHVHKALTSIFEYSKTLLHIEETPSQETPDENPTTTSVFEKASLPQDPVYGLERVYKAWSDQNTEFEQLSESQQEELSNSGYHDDIRDMRAPYGELMVNWSLGELDSEITTDMVDDIINKTTVDLPDPEQSPQETLDIDVHLKSRQ